MKKPTTQTTFCSAQDCKLAIGNITSSSKQPFYNPSSFVLLPKPGINDWLHSRKEAGQPFASFTPSSFNPITKQKHTLYVLLLDDATHFPMLRLQAFLAAHFFGTKVKLLPMQQEWHKIVQKFPGRVNAGKRQLLTGPIFDFLKSILPSDAYCLLAVTMTDLYKDESYNFVFGVASTVARIGVFSFARYDPQFYDDDEEQRAPNWQQILFKRSCKVAAHEIGHMFGIKHCIYYKCLMNGSNHLEESDGKWVHLCPVDLHKLQLVIGFDEHERYKALLAFFINPFGNSQHADLFAMEAAWIQALLASVPTKTIM